MSITTTLTWTDLKNTHTQELQELQQAHQELREQAREEYGDQYDTHPLDAQLPDPQSAPDDLQRLASYQMLAQQYNEQKKTIEKRVNLLERLEDELGGGEWEIKMLSGQETIDIETELRMEAQSRDVDMSVIQHKRSSLMVDAAVVDAPEGVPRDDDGSPVPSRVANPLVMTLSEQVQKFTTAGDMDFTAEGFSSGTLGSGVSGTSASPTPSSDSISE